MKSKLTGPKTALILDGLKNGKTEAEIARDCSVHQSSISRFLKKIKPHFQGLEDLTAHRGDILNLLHGKSLKVQHAILNEVEKMIEDNEKKAPSKRMKLSALLYCLRGVGMNQSGLHGQMRLEEGMSTSNVSLAGMVKHANEVSPFDPATGEFKASIAGSVEKKVSTRGDALTDLVENE